MLPAYIIGLREGLEAALIVGIIAAFLRVNRRGDLLRWVLVGVLLASSICLAAGIALHLLERSLPHKQQEGLETIVGLVAVVVITYMVFWMRGHARSMRADLETSARDALAQGSAAGLVAMAFLAVFREGLETAVFLVAAFQSSVDSQATGAGAVLGILCAIVIGVGIYGGGIRFDLSKFFRITGVVLILVAAGLMSAAMHTAHEAGWISILQEPVLNLEWLVRPGTVTSALVTGMFGIQAHPTQAEVLAWVFYAVPLAIFVAWPPPSPRRSTPAEATVRSTT
jgi:high-affinity iron transporter